MNVNAVVTYIDLAAIEKNSENVAVFNMINSIIKHNTSKELNIHSYKIKNAIVRVRPYNQEYGDEDIKLLVLHELLALEHIQGLLFSVGAMLHCSTSYGEFKISNKTISGSTIEENIKLISKIKYYSRILLSSDLVKLIKLETEDKEIENITKHIKKIIMRK